MALVKCKDCGTKISRRAKSCPSCGAPNKPEAGIISTGCGCLILLIGVFICAGLLPETEADAKVRELEAAMDAGTFRLGADQEQILEVMNGRITDSRERRGDERLLIYKMDDGSELVFVMVPRGGAGSNMGLELDYVTSR